MQYKIIVDKQSRANPSADKKEYMINIEELRTTGSVSDSLVITKDEAYVLRRLKLTEYHVLEELENPVKQTLADVKIELFEGDNYIYLIDMTGNKFYAEYLIKNDFTDNYVTKSEMTSAINQSAGAIELTVNQKLDNYSTTEEMNSTIKLSADSINSEVKKKVGNDEIISKINQSAEAITILASKLGLTAEDVLNLISNNVLNLTTKNLIIQSTYFNVTKDGKVKITGNKNLIIGDTNSNYISLDPGEISLWDTSGGTLSIMSNALVMMSNYNSSSMTPDEISAPTITQTSLEEKKKNFEKLTLEEAIEILNDTDIYKYNLKSQDDDKKKHIGFVIGNSFNYSNKITSEDNNGVDNYSMTSVLYPIVKEQQKQIEELKQRIENLEKGEENGNT